MFKRILDESKECLTYLQSVMTLFGFDIIDGEFIESFFSCSHKINHMEVEKMKQDKIFEATRKAAEMPLEFTHSVVEQSKKLRTPSPSVTKIGTTIGGCVGGGLLFTGAVQLLTGRPLWAFGTASAGVVMILSNLFCYHRNKKQK